ncbi:MAG: helix-turn-helix transcriptional regulator [Henriciella sp.]|uniref:helix-turn-helix domain-containing protein n=1 Tax=Henriciella sp. TaxID=1968823 RepID=UPI003C76F686
MSDSKLPSRIDRLIGQRLRWRRKELKWTQEQLGELLGLTFQQVQKYEKGVNRISAGRLYEISSVLEVPVLYFYEGAEEYLSLPQSQFAEDSEAAAPLPEMDQEAMELIAAFQRIEDDVLRKSLLATIKAAASPPKPD